MAAASDVRSQRRRFYCHLCRAEVGISADFTCLRCSDGFVEEIVDRMPGNRHWPVNSTRSRGQNRSQQRDDFRSAVMSMFMDIFDLMGNTTGRSLAEPNTSNMANSETNLENTENPNNNLRRTVFIDELRDRLRTWLTSRLETIAAREPYRRSIFDDFFDSVFGSIGGVNANFNLGNQTFFMNNPNENATRDDNIETMLTNLINHLSANGSLPLSKEKIDQIPKVEITNEDIAKNDICAVCWEQFQVKEIVRKLPCNHLFHEPCILPWLKMHRTCPICRSWLNDKLTCERSNSTNNSNSGDNNDEAGQGGSGVSNRNESGNEEDASTSGTGSSDDFSSVDVLSSLETSSQPDNTNE